MAITLDANKGITYPNWTTAGRPVNPVAGQMGYNTTLGVIEVYNGTVWTTMVGGPWTTAGRPATPATGLVGYNTTYNGVEVYNGTAWSTISGGPAFSAYQGVQQTGISNYVATKVNLDTENFDTNNNFASSRFTPTVAGYYQLNASVQIPYASSAAIVLSILYKNGSPVSSGSSAIGSGSMYPISSTSCVLYMNGTTDYVELYTYGAPNTGSTYNMQTGIDRTYFNGFLARGV